MMTTNRIRPDYYYYNPSDENNPNNSGTITNRTTNGQYTITEKDFGDHKLFYYVPSTYDNDYDISQLDETPPPIIVKRKYYQQYDDDYYNEALPMITPRRYVYASPRRPQVVRKIYYEPPPKQTVEYIYEDDYRPKNENIIEYIVRDRVPRRRYIEEPQPIRQTVYVENLPPIRRSPRPSHYLNELSSPRRSKIKQESPRFESPNKSIVGNNNQPKHMSLKDVIAGNRARRGSRIPKPRREVDEEACYDPPTYRRNYIKNDFIVHK